MSGTYASHLQDQYTSLGTQNLAPKLHFSNFVSLQLSQVYAHKNFVFEYMNSLTIIEEE